MSNDRVYVYLVQHCSCLVVLLDGCEGFAYLIHALSLLKNPGLFSSGRRSTQRSVKIRTGMGRTSNYKATLVRGVSIGASAIRS